MEVEMVVEEEALVAVAEVLLVPVAPVRAVVVNLVVEGVEVAKVGLCQAEHDCSHFLSKEKEGGHRTPLIDICSCALGYVTLKLLVKMISSAHLSLAYSITDINHADTH